MTWRLVVARVLRSVSEVFRALSLWLVPSALPAAASRPRLSVPELPSPVPDTVRARTAAHEAGHGLLAWYATIARSLSVRINLADGVAAVQCNLPSRRTPMVNWIHLVICCGGMAAEARLYGRFRSGPACEDLAQARVLVRALLETGYEPEVERKATGLRSDAFRRMFVSALTEHEERLLSLAYGHARALIASQWSRYERLLSLLLVRDTLTEPEMQIALGDRFPVLILQRLDVAAFVMPPRATEERPS